MGDRISAVASADWHVAGRRATHLPTGRMVVHQAQTMRDGEGHVWQQSRLEGLDGASADVQQQAMLLWHSGRLGRVVTAPPGLLGVA